MIVEERSWLTQTKRHWQEVRGWHRIITLPAQVNDGAKVQIWCAYAEVLLGEAAFPKSIVMRRGKSGATA